MAPRDPGPPLADQAVRDAAAADFERNWALTAGAGTGKTTLLIRRLLNALGQRMIRPEGLAALTFSEAAAAELRERLRAEVEKKAGIEGPRREAWERILHDLDRAQVTTIHAFALAILREAPVEAGIDPGMGIADPVEARLLLSRAWRRFLGRELVGEDEAWLKILARGGLEEIGALARGLVGDRDILAEGPRLGDPVEVLESRTDRITGRIEQASRLAALHCRDAEDTVVKRLAELEEFVAGAGPDELLRRAIEGKCPGTSRARTHKNWPDRETFERAREAVDTAARELEALRELPEIFAIHEATRLAMGKLTGLFELYEEEKRRAGVLDFQDLLVRARNLLRDEPGVRRRLARRFRQVLVDEFQDTDPLQAEILLFLCEDPGAEPATCAWKVRLEPGKLFVVGDPKQSIYGWRRADMAVYADLRALVREQGGREEALRTNFRSTGQVVELVNSIFEGRMRRTEEGRLQPDYAPIDRGRSEPDPREPLLHLLAVRPETGRDEDSTSLSTDEASRAEARAVARLLADLRESPETLRVAAKEGTRRAALGDVAVLGETASVLRYYEEAFQEADLPYIVVGGKDFFRRPEIADMVLLLRALADPLDLLSLVGALRSPLFALTDQDLLALAGAGRLDLRGEIEEGSLGDPRRESRTRQARDCLLRWREMSRRITAGDLIETILDESPLAAAAAAGPDGLRRIANLDKLRFMAERYAPSTDPTVGGLLDVLETLGEDLPDEGESPLSEAGAHAVRLMTIHKAKGLEFPILVLGGLHKVGGKGAARAEVVHRRRSGENRPLLGVSIEVWETLSWATELGDWEKRRREAERLRLLYVAMTRARDHLVLAGGLAPHRQAGNWLDDVLDRFGLAPEDLVAQPDETEGEAGERLLEIDSLSVRLRVVQPAPPRLIPRRSVAEVADAELPEPDLPARAREAHRTRAAEGEGRPADASVTWLDRERRAERTGPAARGTSPQRDQAIATGIAVHAVLEELSPGREEGWEAKLEARTAHHRGEAAAAIRSRSAELLGALFDSELWRDLGQAVRSWSEVPVAVELEEEGLVAHGRIDLVVERPDGGIEAIDWKTDDLSGREAREAAADHTAQARVYGRGLAAAFGRPISRFVFFYLDGCRAVTLEGGEIEGPPLTGNRAPR